MKNSINKKLLERMAESLVQVHPAFDRKKFVALAPRLEELELKARVQRVRDQLHEQLPADYKKALGILLKSLKSEGLRGFDLWPYTEFVQTYGLDQPELSLLALREMTVLFTSEFAVRPFLREHGKLTLAFLLKCSSHPNPHVRRWVSEGTRPRLPWGERLQEFVRDPAPVLPLLEKLKYDEELYVRKSVANHLNDIAKDHPETVLGILKRWGASVPPAHEEKIRWITRHALRTLIKSGHPEALALMGARGDIKIKARNLELKKSSLRMNETMEFAFEVESLAKKPQTLIVDYVIHHQKAGQKTSAKVFKLKTLTLAPGERRPMQKRHALKPITTRKYYSGDHLLEIQINGKIYLRAKWVLKV